MASLAVCLLLSLVACNGGGDETDQEKLWSAAMADAVFSEDDEVRELVCLTQGDDKVIWDAAGERVLLLTWHDYDGACERGASLPTDGEIWATSMGEMISWYKENRGETENWNLRFAQLLGVHADEGYTRFTAFWVGPENVVRPAYSPDVTHGVENNYAGMPEGDFKDWFDNNILWSYFQSDYPWTRLGYTYDWSGVASEYGLTEFVLFGGQGTEIEGTWTTLDFVTWLDEYIGE